MNGVTRGRSGKGKRQDGTGLKEEEMSLQEERQNWDTWRKEKGKAKEDSVGYVDRQDTLQENAPAKEKAKEKG